MITNMRESLVVSFGRMRMFSANFRTNSRANVAVTFALASLPIIAAIGCVTDYSMASMIKTKLQAAADAATLATISNNSPILTTAKSMSGNGTVTGGSTYMQNFFNSDTTAFSGVSPTGTVTKTGTTITATLAFSDSVPTTFMKILGYANINVAGSSTASITLPSYISFYLMLDVLRLHELPLHQCGAGEAHGGQSRQPAPDEQSSQQWLSAGVPIRLPLGLAEHHVQSNLGPKWIKRSVAGIMASVRSAVRRQRSSHSQSMVKRLSRRLLFRISHFTPGNKPGVIHQRLH